VQVTAESGQVGLYVHGIQLQFEVAEGILPLEESDEGDENQQENEGSEENKESAEVRTLQVDLRCHLNGYFLPYISILKL
jgi:hypothetical protein